MKRISRRGFFSALRTENGPVNPVKPAPAPARTFLEDFYAERARNPQPALVCEPTTFVWDEALIARYKRKGET